MYRICHVTSHDHSFEASCDCLCGSSPGKSCDHRHCDSGDMFLACHVTSREHI